MHITCQAGFLDSPPEEMWLFLLSPEGHNLEEDDFCKWRHLLEKDTWDQREDGSACLAWGQQREGSRSVGGVNHYPVTQLPSIRNKKVKDLLTRHFPSATVLKMKILDIFFHFSSLERENKDMGRQRKREMLRCAEVCKNITKILTFLMAPKVALPSIYRLLFDFLTGVTGKKQQRGALNLQKSNSRWEKKWSHRNLRFQLN